MSNDERVYNTLSDVGVPGARMLWGPQPPDPPYFTYEVWPRSIFADSGNHAMIDRYKVQLHLDKYDEDLVTRFEQAISGLGTYIRHSDEVEDGLFVLTWGFSMVRGAE